MISFRFSRFVMVGAIALLGIGCRATTPSTPSSLRVGATSASAGFACPHSYYPLTRGFAIDYVAAGGPIPGPHRVEVVAASSTGAEVRTTYPTYTASQFVRCAADGGLTGSGSVDFLSASLRGADVSIESVEGDLLPPHLAVGSDWTTSMNIHMRFANNPAMRQAAALSDVRGRITMHHRATGSENISVSAGQFSTIKIETTINTSLDLPGGHASVNPLGADAHVDEWWAEGTGVVKTMTPLGGGTVIIGQAVHVARP